MFCSSAVVAEEGKGTAVVVAEEVCFIRTP